MVSLTKPGVINRGSIQRYVGLASFQKGERYALNKAISQGKIKHQVLTALCKGHEFDPYRVEAIFKENGIQQSYCSCPVGAGGKCKHVAALLLTWLDHPDQFSDWKELHGMLESCDAQALMELIDLLEEKVESSAEIIQTFKKNLTTVHSPSLAKYFRKIEEAFYVSDLPWYHPDEGGLTEICFSLVKIRSDADQLCQEGHAEKGVKIYQVIIQHILNYLDDHRDPWGNLREELKGCMQSLETVLQHSHLSQEWRLKVFQLLFRLIEEQIYRDGDIGSEEARRIILSQVQPAERDRMISWIQAIQETYPHEAKGKEREETGLEDFLIDLQRDRLDPEIYLSHYRQTGQIHKLIDSLLRLGRVEEAHQIALEPEFFSQRLALAHLFIVYQQGEIAESLALSFAKQRTDFSTFRWLKDFYLQKGDDEKALYYALEMLYLSPQFTYYQISQEIALRLGNWDRVHEAILGHFKDADHPLLLLEIYLDEKKLIEAIHLFNQLADKVSRPSRDIHYTLLALRLAGACRQKHPETTLRIYQEMIQEYIEERNREGYQKACDYLKLVRSLYSDLQQMEAWEIYFKNLMQTYRRLKALKDEMHQSGLLF